MRINIVGKSFIVEFPSFNLKITPRFSIGETLVEPDNITAINDDIFLLEDKAGTIKLEFRKYRSTVIVKVKGGKRYTVNGIPLVFKIENLVAKKYLVYQFSHDPPEYFSKKEEINYPVFKEVSEDDYCAWNYPIHLDSLNLPVYYKVSQILLHKDDSNMFILPITNNGFRAVLSIFKDEEASIVLESRTDTVWDELYVFAFSWGKNVYDIIEKTYFHVFKELNKEHFLRKNKEILGIFRYLGWCSWNALYHNVSSEKVMKIVEEILEEDVKIKYVLIDDGWELLNDSRQVKSFEPDLTKFPEGFYEFSLKVKKLGIRWIGLWHTINVYWRGIDPESSLARKMLSVLRYGKYGLIPDSKYAYFFFNKWYHLLRKWNIDFVKVDNQSSIGYEYAGHEPIEDAASRIHEGLEAAGYVNGIDVLNCMAMQPENFFNWPRSAIARNSMDYIPGLVSRGKLHLYFNAYNALWMSQIVWPDWDMFQSNDPLALQHVVARAISGGPIYFTDEQGTTKAEVLKPLAFSDGKLPLPDSPALPTKDIIFRDPFNESVPLKIFTYVDVPGIGKYYLLAAFNINRDDAVEDLKVDPSVFMDKEYIVYEYFSKRYYDSVIEEKLGPHETKLYVIAPVKGWLTPIGSSNIYVMPRALEYVYVTEDEAILRIYEEGNLVLYTKDKVSVVDGAKVIEEKPLVLKAFKKIIHLKRNI